MAKLVFLNKDFAGKEFELLREITSVGRAMDNTLVIHDNSISAHHCDISTYGSEVIVREKDSTNGTFVEGLRVAAQAPVKNRQVIRLGEVEMRLELDLPDKRYEDTEITTVYSLAEVERERRREAKVAKRPAHGEVGDQSQDEDETLVLAREKVPGHAGLSRARTDTTPHEPLYILPEPKRVARRWLIATFIVLLLLLLAVLLWYR
jgi:hypothetical protein